MIKSGKLWDLLTERHILKSYTGFDKINWPTFTIWNNIVWPSWLKSRKILQSWVLKIRQIVNKSNHVKDQAKILLLWKMKKTSCIRTGCEIVGKHSSMSYVDSIENKKELYLAILMFWAKI